MGSQKEQQNQALTAQLSKAENDKQKSDKALHVVQQRAKEQIGTLQQSLKRYETQSEQTKSLLKLIKNNEHRCKKKICSLRLNWMMCTIRVLVKKEEKKRKE